MKKICTRIHFPSLPSFDDPTQLVFTFLTGCIDIKWKKKNL